MKVLLIKDIPKLGQKNTIHEVSDTFALNVLIPQNKAVRATPDLEKRVLAAKSKKESDKKIKESIFLTAVQKISNPLVITAKSDKDGHLFGSINEEQIVDAIYNDIKLSLNKKQITISSPIKKLGMYKVKLSQSTDAKEINIEVKN
jgi:large subunit ribosomal protein L9